MKLIIDTHILLWWALNDRRLPDKAHRLIENTRNTIFVSTASIWEIAIKKTLGRIKIDLNDLEESIVKNNFESLPIRFRHAIELSEIPSHHNDPFDRILVAQCLVETACLLTHDEQLEKYGKVVMVV